MAENERPNLSLGTPPGNLRQANGGGRGLVWLVLVIQIATLVVLFVIFKPGASTQSVSIGGMSNVETDHKTLAMQLEQRSLNTAAAEAWQAHLVANPNSSDVAQLQYRIGKLYSDAGEYERAATALIAAEIAAGDDKDLKDKIGPRLIDCLRKLGLQGEVGRELSRRVQTGASDVDRGKVLVEFAGEQLTDADLDRVIERRVDQMMAMQPGTADASQRRAILKQFENPSMRKQILRDWLRSELFARRARELKLDQDEQFQNLLEQTQTSLLATRLMTKELAKIAPAEVDLKSFLAANEAKYSSPATLRVAAVPVDGAAGKALLETLDSPEKFMAHAKTKLTDGGPGLLHDLTKGQRHDVLGRVDRLFAGEVNQTKAHSHGDKNWLVLIREKTEASVPPFSDIQQTVARDYAQQKQQQLLEKLMTDLMARYDVKLKIDETP